MDWNYSIRLFFADSTLNLCRAILIQGPQMGARKPVGNDIYFFLIGGTFISVELKNRQNVLSPFQDLLGLSELVVSYPQGRQKGRPLVIPKLTYG
jgi:hypothetical protein